MGVNYSPKIVTDGLLIYLDAANPKSYLTGNTWYDLKNNYTASLYNSPAFSEKNLYFDGWNLNQYGIIGNISYNRTYFSVFAWFNFPEYHVSWRCAAVSKWNTGAGTALNEWSIGAHGISGPCPIGGGVQYDNAGNGLIISTPDNYNVNTWYNLGFVFDNGNLSLYKNGDLIGIQGVGAPTTMWTSTQPIQIATFYSDPTIYPARIKIANVMIYNKALNSIEIKQNHYTLKQILGL